MRLSHFRNSVYDRILLMASLLQCPLTPYLLVKYGRRGRNNDRAATQLSTCVWLTRNLCSSKSYTGYEMHPDLNPHCTAMRKSQPLRVCSSGSIKVMILTKHSVGDE